MASKEFPTIKDLVNLIGPLGPTDRKTVDNWQTLSPQLQAMVPHVAELIVRGIGSEKTWAEMTEAERNIMNYTAIHLLAEAQKRAANLKKRPC